MKHHHVDMFALGCVTVLGCFHALPEGMIASLVTLVVVGRLRPPSDKGGGTGGVGSALASSGLVGGAIAVIVFFASIVSALSRKS